MYAHLPVFVHFEPKVSAQRLTISSLFVMTLISLAAILGCSVLEIFLIKYRLSVEGNCLQSLMDSSSLPVFLVTPLWEVLSNFLTRGRASHAFIYQNIKLCIRKTNLLVLFIQYLSNFNFFVYS